MKKAILTALMVVASVGCGQRPFGQDPLEGYPDSVRNGVPPTERIEKPDRSPLPQEGYRIDIDDVVEFSEDQESTIEFTARVLVDVKDFTVDIDNIKQFEGAKIDLVSVKPDPQDPKNAGLPPKEKKYRLTWKPAVGVVAASIYSVLPMNLTLSADVNGLATQRTKTIKVVVNKEFKVPKIVSAAFEKYDFVEGDKNRLTVIIEDLDSTEQEPPRIRFEKPNSGYDGSVYLKFVSLTQDATKKTTWKAVYDLDTKDLDLTSNEQNIYVYLFAISRFGVKSQSYSNYTYITNLVSAPLVSLTPNKVFNFVKGVRNEFSFTIVDPTKDGEVSGKLKTAITSLPGKIDFQCDENSSAAYSTTCTFSWELASKDKTDPSYTFEAELTNDGYSGWTPKSQSVVVPFKINIVTPAANGGEQ